METIEKQEVVAGRELDAEVARRVMGWTRWDLESGEDCPCEPGVTYFADWGAMGGLAVYTPPHLTGDVEFNFEPSGDIADAWKVEERLKALGRWKEYGFSLASLVRPDLVAGESIGNLYAELAHASPELRCRAALLALEADNA